jgi:hypothetical protein
LRRHYGNERIYNHWDPTQRVQVDLYATPQTDDDGREIRLYTSDGRKVHRRDAFTDPDDKECGILIDLRTIGNLYVQGDDPDFQEEPATLVSAYPQAYLRSYGHIQASGIMWPFHRILDGIQANVGKPVQRLSSDDDSDDSHNEDSELESDSDSPRMKAVFGIGSQGYNELSHRIAPRAGAHDVQKGMITAALAGAYTLPHDGLGQRSARRHFDDCARMLPIDRFKAKISHADCPRALRMEQIYYVDIFALKKGKATGK